MLHDVTVELGGQTRTLRCDLGAWAKLEDYESSVEDALHALSNGGLKMRLVQRLVASMLWREQVTLDQVGEWVTGANFGYVMEQVGLALRQAFPQGERADPPPAPSGSGSASSSLGPTAD